VADLPLNFAARVETLKDHSSADLVLIGMGSTGMAAGRCRALDLVPASTRDGIVSAWPATVVHGGCRGYRHEMVHGALVGDADVHAGALADGFQPLQHSIRGTCRELALGRIAFLPPPAR